MKALNLEGLYMETAMNHIMSDTQKKTLNIQKAFLSRKILLRVRDILLMVS